MVVGWTALATDAPARSLLHDPRFLLGTAALAGVLLVGAMVIALVKRWRQRQDQSLPTTGDQLCSFRVLYEQGELSREEFEQIRARLAQQLKGELQASTAPPAPSPPSETPAGEGPAA